MKRLMPKILKFTFFYKSSFQIACDTNLSYENRIQKIEKLEDSFGGRDYLIEKVKKHTPSTFGIMIGKKDIGKIFISLDSSSKALQYLHSAEHDLAIFQNNEESLFRKIHVWILLAKAYALQGDIEECYKFYDNAIENSLSQIDKDPSSDRFNNLYAFSIQEAYNSHIRIEEKFPSKSEKVCSKVEELFTKYSKLDIGNEQILKYLNLLQ